MESTEIYYSENSENVEEDNAWDMNDVVIVESENHNWQEEGPEVTVDYDNASGHHDQILTENDMYLSDDAEDSTETDQTKYYSVLETTYKGDDTLEGNVSASIVVNVDNQQEVILPDASYNDDTVYKETVEDESLSDQVILYSTDDPNEMYAVQIADDGNGNFQRYKYKVRPTGDGQFEAIPGTIEVQDENEIDIIEKDETEKPPTTKNNCQVDTTPQNVVHLKKDIYIEDSSLDNSDIDEEYGTPEYLLSENEPDENFTAEIPGEDDFTLQISNNYLEVTPDIEEDSNTGDFTEKIINSNQKKRKFFKSRGSNIQSQVANIIKNKKFSNEVTVYKDDKKVTYLLVDPIEKENVDLTEEINLPIKNSRSLLKNTYIIPVEDAKKNKTTIRMLNNKTMEAKDSVKTINENTEVVNLVDKNKITEKSARQPRKQTIKPVERLDSEIIVQPVFYSLYENLLEEIPKKRKYNRGSVDEVVKVSDDSDPDYTDNPKPKKRKSFIGRKKHKKVTHITISDSDSLLSDEESVIEILSGNTDKSNKETEDKNSDTSEMDISINDLEKSDDILKIQEAVDNIVQERDKKIKEKAEEDKTSEEKIKNNKMSKTIVKKNKIKCPICPKTFPRELLLKNHMNVHKTRRSLRRKNEDASKIEAKPKHINTDIQRKLDKFYCGKCKLKFLTEIQLKRHLTIHKDRKVALGTPKKIQTMKKSFSPLKLRRTLNITKNDRKKNITNTIDVKNVVTSPRRPFKCDQCPLSYSQRTLLTSHKQSHNRFHCSKCNIRFTSKNLLDAHIQKKCGKSDVLKRKSIVRSPLKPKSRMSQIVHTCKTCKQNFHSLNLLHEHETKSHKRPVVNIKDVSTRSTRPHGGVPTSTRMQKAFDMMKLKS